MEKNNPGGGEKVGVSHRNSPSARELQDRVEQEMFIQGKLC